MNMNKLLQKLSSRKLWLAFAGVATGVALALGVDTSEITAVAGAVTALASVVTYIVTEGRVDTAAVRAGLGGAREAVSALKEEGKP